MASEKGVPASASLAQARGVSQTSFELDCTRCGACCAPRSDWSTYVHVPPAERARLPPRFALQVIDEELATISDPVPSCDGEEAHRPLRDPRGSSSELERVPRWSRPNTPGVRCVALEGELGLSVRCAMHQQRPSACRRFRAGSRACLEARAEVLGLE
ncbi:MAG: YkgJ family cysteine cluster protein [Myxococcales bacterium]|nr:YkgJ family cysteine cluster protein [Myxococcales bacterium]